MEINEKFRKITDRILIDSFYENWIKETENSDIFKLFIQQLDKYISEEFGNIVFKLDPYKEKYCYEVCLTNKNILDYSYRSGYIYPKSNSISSTCFLNDNEDSGNANDLKSINKLIKKCFKRKKAKEDLQKLNNYFQEK